MKNKKIKQENVVILSVIGMKLYVKVQLAVN